ncbi:MAG TPA: hypothetical protein VGF56_00465 [Rhizomicrobium sp.]|jgi:hypothetical protein
MMRKIPVGKTISEAYGYAFGQFPANLGITWLPLALLFGAAIVLFPHYIDAVRGMADAFKGMHPGAGDDGAVMAQVGAANANISRFSYLFLILEILFLTQITLGMTRRALGLDRGPVFFFVSIGTSYWRLVGAYFIMFILQYVVFFAVFLAGALVGAIVAMAVGIGAGGAGIEHNPGLLAFVVAGAVVLIIACLFAAAYFLVRLTFLLTPAIVAEDKFALFRSWELTKGNFWRIFAIALAVIGPVALLGLILEGAMFAQVWPDISHILASPSAAGDPQAVMRVSAELTTRLADLFTHYWYVLAAVYLLTSTLTYGLAMGAAASAYRSQTETA